MSNRTIKTCSIDGCEKKHDARGYCAKHYQQRKRTSGFKPVSPAKDNKCKASACKSLVGDKGAKGMCSTHYQRWRRYGDPLHELPSWTERICDIAGCGNTHDARGLCKVHYSKWKIHGDPLAEQKIFPNAESAFAARTKKNGNCVVWTGALNDNGYGSITDNKKVMYAHRYAWERVNGKIPDGMLIDHICHNRSCVKATHLRLAEPSQNVAYRNGASAKSKSGVLNVYPARKKWVVQVKDKYKTYSFGTFETIAEAAEVAREARQEMHGEFAWRG